MPVETALVSGVRPLGDIEIHLGGSEGGASSSFLVALVVRMSSPPALRGCEVRFERMGAVHLDDHVRFATTMRPMSPRVALAFAREQPLPERARSLLAMDAVEVDPAVDVLPAPTNDNERLAFMADAPFPSGLVETEMTLLGLERPSVVRVTPRSPSIARAREAASELASREIGRLRGTPIEDRVARITSAVLQVLAWTGQTPRAQQVAAWQREPLASHPLARSLVVDALMHGGGAAPPADGLRLLARERLRTHTTGRTRRDLLELELGASIAATLSAWFHARTFREEHPDEDALVAAGRAGAAAAIGPGGGLASDAARDAVVRALSEAGLTETRPESIRSAAELVPKSVARLTELAAKPPVREWARGPLDQILGEALFLRPAPR